MPYVRVAIDKSQTGAAYEVLRTGDDSAILINTWETQAQAEAAVQSASQWVRDNVAPKILSVETYVGELTLSPRR
jgi:hypothetical protein